VQREAPRGFFNAASAEHPTHPKNTTGAASGLISVRRSHRSRMYVFVLSNSKLLQAKFRHSLGYQVVLYYVLYNNNNNKNNNRVFCYCDFRFFLDKRTKTIECSEKPVAVLDLRFFETAPSRGFLR